MVFLKNIENLEVEQTYNWLQNRSLRELFMMKTVPTLEQHKNYYKKLLNDDSQKVFAIYIYILNKHIGNCGLKYLDTDYPELWIYIGEEEERGKGFATLACEELLKYFQETYKKPHIYIHVLKTNFIAIKLYKHLGFEIIEHQERDKEIWKDSLELVYTMKKSY